MTKGNDMDTEWIDEPRDYALELVDNGLVDADHMNLILLKYMSHDDVRGALEANELDPDAIAAE